MNAAPFSFAKCRRGEYTREELVAFFAPRNAPPRDYDQDTRGGILLPRDVVETLARMPPELVTRAVLEPLDMRSSEDDELDEWELEFERAREAARRARRPKNSIRRRRARALEPGASDRRVRRGRAPA